MSKVLDRYTIKNRGEAIVLDARGKCGDIIRCGDRSWVVLGVETHAMNPKPPFGFLLGESAPEVGEDVTIENAGLPTLTAKRRFGMRNGVVLKALPGGKR